MTDTKAPDRIWASETEHGERWWMAEDHCGAVEYIRAALAQAIPPKPEQVSGDVSAEREAMVAAMRGASERLWLEGSEATRRHYAVALIAAGWRRPAG